MRRVKRPPRDNWERKVEEVGLTFHHSRNEDGIPTGWVQRVKSSLRTVGARFSASRLLDDYVRTAYRLRESEQVVGPVATG